MPSEYFENRQDGVIQITERDEPCLEESITLPEINMAPKTPGLEDDFSYLEGLKSRCNVSF